MVKTEWLSAAQAAQKVKYVETKRARQLSAAQAAQKLGEVQAGKD